MARIKVTNQIPSTVSVVLYSFAANSFLVIRGIFYEKNTFFDTGAIECY